MAKRPQRLQEWQEYRDNLAHDLKELRKYGDTGRELSKTLLEKEKEMPLYKYSNTFFLRESELKRESRSKRIIEIIDSKDYDKVERYIKKGTSDYKLNVDVAKRLIKEGLEKLIVIDRDKFRPTDEMIELFLTVDRRDHLDRRDFGWLRNYLFIVGKKPELTGCLTKKSLKNLIDAGILYIANLCIFRGLDKESLFMILDKGITIENYKTLLYNLDNFNGLDKEAFNVLVSYRGGCLEILGDDGRKLLGQHIDKFEGLGEDEAKLLTKKGYGRYVAQHPENFGLKKEK